MEQSRDSLLHGGAGVQLSHAQWNQAASSKGCWVVQQLFVMVGVRVRGWGMHRVKEDPHRYKSTDVGTCFYLPYCIPLPCTAGSLECVDTAR